SPDRKRLLVTSAWAHTVSEYALPSWERLGAVSIAREPRSVVTSSDGQYAFVTHAVGSAISKVALADFTAASNASAEAVLLGGRDFTPQQSFRGCCMEFSSFNQFDDTPGVMNEPRIHRATRFVSHEPPVEA